MNLQCGAGQPRNRREPESSGRKGHSGCGGRIEQRNNNNLAVEVLGPVGVHAKQRIADVGPPLLLDHELGIGLMHDQLNSGL